MQDRGLSRAGHAVQQNGWSLKYASDDMKNNEKVVLAAVQQNGESLQYASKDMKNNYDSVYKCH